MRSPKIRSRVSALVAVLVSLLLTTTGYSAMGQVGDEPTPAPLAPATQAQDTVSPSVVFLAIHWEGWVYVPRFLDLGVSGWQGPVDGGPYEADTMCSGYVQSAEGHVVTASHCVDDKSMNFGGSGLIIQTMLQEWVSYGFPQRLVPQMYEVLTMNAKVEGEDAGSPPGRQITVYPTFAGGNVQNSEPLQASVVDLMAFTDGDVALLKVDPPGPWPALEVAEEAPAAQTDVLAAGYPGSVTQVTDFSLEPSFKDGKVSGTQEVQGVPFTQISAATTQGMSGGPTVDLEGRVVGLVSWGPTYEPQSFNFITETEVLRSLLSRNDVLEELSATDQAYRAGLDAYAAGDYEAAVEQFDTVLAAIPNHLLAQQYRQKALVAPSDSGGFPVVPVSIGAAVAVALAIAVLLVLRRRAGTRGTPRVAEQPPPVPSRPSAAVVPPGPATATATRPVETRAMEAAPPSDRQALQPPGRTMFCPNCGKQHPVEAHFCDACGQPFAAAIGGPTEWHAEQHS